jgi:alkylation response protein AidB-like acyl-CoA dehydrogenase
VQPTMDRGLHLASVVLTGAAARHAGSLTAGQVARLDALRPIAASAIQIGGARRCLEQTVQYLQTRTQFGRPLGSFQALKHRVADLLVLAETGDSASWGAAAAWAADAPDAALLAGIAGTYCAEAYREVTAQTVQLHGGIAITWEHDAHRHLKQAHTMATVFGTPADHRARLAAALL